MSARRAGDLIQMLLDLPTSDVWWLVSGVFGALAAIFAVGYFFGVFVGSNKQVRDQVAAEIRASNLEKQLQNHSALVASSVNELVGLDPSQVEGGAFIREAGDLESLKQKLLSEARYRVCYFGASFHVSTSTHRKKLEERLKAGVELRFVFADPDGQLLTPNAASFGQTQEEFRSEVSVTLANLQSMSQALGSERLQFRMLDEIFVHGVYMYDVDALGNGSMILVPHVWGHDAPAVPAVIVTGPAGKSVLRAYRAMFEHKWERAKSARIPRDVSGIVYGAQIGVYSSPENQPG
jgi:hypothetical protein